MHVFAGCMCFGILQVHVDTKRTRMQVREFGTRWRTWRRSNVWMPRPTTSRSHRALCRCHVVYMHACAHCLVSRSVVYFHMPVHAHRHAHAHAHTHSLPLHTQRQQAAQGSTSTAAATRGARAQGAHTAAASRPRSRTYMTDKEAREDLFRSMDRAFDKSRQQDAADAARLRRLSAAQRVRPNPVIDSLTHYAERQRAQDLADEKHLAAPLALSASASLVHREHKQAEAAEAVYQSAVKDALGLLAPQAGVGHPSSCTVSGRPLLLALRQSALTLQAPLARVLVTPLTRL